MSFEEIRELIKIFAESTISKLSIKQNDTEIALEKGGIPVDIAPVVVQHQQSIKQNENQNELESKISLTLNSPMVGTFYSSPAPNAQSFIKVGDKVTKGQTIGILEAMKIMNEWEADFNCKIVKFLVEDGRPVEYGTPIFEVEKI
jgi:acetyl-CoA carboxylase biotin carboxyl carrier protein